MLVSLHVENLALIDHLDLEFEPGLTVLTGETGAGKSIIVDAINALLGERTSGEAVREGAEKALIEGAFDISTSPGIGEALNEQGLEPEDLLILSRDVTFQGRSQARVNGRMATLGNLRGLTELLADVHGQHEHQLLLAPRWQLEFLDAFAGEEDIAIRVRLETVWRDLQQVSRDLQRISSDSRERERLGELYRYQVGEIKDAALRVGEEEELQAEAVRLANLEKLFLAARSCQELLSGEEGGGAIDAAGSVLKTLQSVAPFDPQVNAMTASVNEALVLLQETQDVVRTWRESLDISPERINQVQARLDQINTLKRKYGETLQDVIAYMEETAQRLGEYDSSEERLAELARLQEEMSAEADTLAGQLTSLRQAAATELGSKVQRELEDLGMAGGAFEVSLEETALGPRGKDQIEFLISANRGESLRPLAKVASGGEASRTMLALKTVLTGADPVGTLVFDEIDAGIGGRTANVVGEKLKQLAYERQVLCVTHLPQIARFADSHLAVAKTESEGRAVIGVRKLKGEERVAELARMLGGDQESEAAVKHARELLGVGAD